MRNLICRAMRRLCGDRGVAGLEAALIMPVMIFFILGVVELYQYFRVAAIMDRAAFAVADGVAMQQKLFDRGTCTLTDDICTYGVIVQQLMEPVDYRGAGYMDIRLFVSNYDPKRDPSTAVWNNTPAWAKRCVGAGTCTNLASTNTLPPGMPSAVGKDSIVVVQVHQEYEPFIISAHFWASLGGKQQLTATVFYRPRFDDLRTLN